MVQLSEMQSVSSSDEQTDSHSETQTVYCWDEQMADWRAWLLVSQWDSTMV
jgi:hypothetical protein